jgi:uncharacterized protein YecE (DUF72 family)
MVAMTGKIHVGVGGWQFEPWRGVFYPDKLPQRRELEYSTRHLTAIEINATYYGAQKPESFRKWAAEAPDGFKFSVKGTRYATNRRDLSQAGESIGRFLNSGLTELGDRLGPLLWQFANSKTYDRDDFSHFLDFLPETADGLKLQHVIEPRHDSFVDPDFVALLRERNVAVAYAHHESYPNIPDVTADFVYARLQRGSDDVQTGYPADELDAWARRLTTWADGGAPEDLPSVAADVPAPHQPRDVYAFVIHEGKVRAPAAAMGLIDRLDPKHAAAGGFA